MRCSRWDMKRGWGARGQSTLEYALLFGLAAAAVMALQVYLRRGVQANMKRFADGVLVSGGGVALPAGRFDPEEAQTFGLTTQAPGTGVDLSNDISRQNIERGADYQERGQAPGKTTRDGTWLRTKTEGTSRFVGQSEIPAEFLLRSGAFDGLGDR